MDAPTGNRTEQGAARNLHDVDAVCRDVGLELPDERSQALARVIYDGGADAGAANRKQLRGTLLALSLGD